MGEEGRLLYLRMERKLFYESERLIQGEKKTKKRERDWTRRLPLIFSSGIYRGLGSPEYLLLRLLQRAPQSGPEWLYI